MNKREYIKKNGMAKARKKYGNQVDSISINWEGQEVGSVCREWHPVYCTWTWKAWVSYEGIIHSFTSTEGSAEGVTWAEKKMKALTNPEFGKSLKELIDLSGFTQSQVAEEVGCSVSVLVKWFKGHSYPGVHSLVRLCKLLAVLDWERLHTELSQLIELERC